MSTTRKLQRSILRANGISNSHMQEAFHKMRGTKAPQKGAAQHVPLRRLFSFWKGGLAR